MKQKDNLEHHAVLNFIELYNRNHKRQLQLIRACRPPMPDTLCCLHRREIGIEVAHVYGSNDEAAMRVGGKTLDDFPHRVCLDRHVTALDVRALNCLHDKLKRKATRTYGFTPTWLLIRNAFVPWSFAEYRQHKNEIIVPETHPFTQIWFMCDKKSLGTPGIMRLA